MTHLMVLMFMSRCFAFTQNHFNPDHRNGLGLAFVFLAVAMVLIISQLTYQWIEKPYQNEFRDLASKRFKAWKAGGLSRY
jgi:peptidoglycan/LPS O-acetylase OafA/YrhL